MVLNFKNDINDFEDWYYTEKKLKKYLPKYRILNIINFLFYVFALWYILFFLKNAFASKGNNALSIFLGIISLLLFISVIISKLNKRIFRILNINRWYKNLLKLDNNFEVEKQVIISDNILKVIAGNFERVIDDDFKIVIDNKKIFIIKDDTKYDTLPKVIIPISAITKSYTEDEFLGKFNNVEIINIK